MMERRGLVELEMEYQGLRVRLKKAASQVAESVAGVPQLVPSPKKGVHAAEEGRWVTVKSPMVGTCYRAPAPDAPPFVEVGQDVEVGQVLCIIEAMKLMNEIKSEVAGRIVDVLVQNGEAVEFGQPLFAVDPQG